ncbi:two-component system, unclassified family, response regulator [Marinobacter daqiaonensis]|uniref:Two-component system, unclassified family, response regulator n=1 Tax=Marinobacter daqiaonensis TaxID=650891 RepID=A0A1I6IKP6_9GAMM|nr:response regulator [Marinobacter daqiaonensis]SFR67219.1 two-component system, unclassified family, response regulator [Marinobacter daqiaonensis]
MFHKLSLRIFIADDDADDRLLIRDAFLEHGKSLELSFFATGDELLHGLQSARTRRALPDMILLDLNMPGKNGREVLSELKGAGGYRRVPVIMLTTSRNEEDIGACYDLGACSYIVKPGSYEALLEVTRSLINYWTQTSVLPGQMTSHAR